MAKTILMRTTGLLVIGATILLATVAESKPLEDYKWIEVRTENFVVRSVLGKSRTEKVARHLEMLKAVFPDSLQGFRRTAAVPDAVYVLKGDWQLKDLGIEPRNISVDFEHEKYAIVATDTYTEYAAARAYTSYLAGNSEFEPQSVWFQIGLDTFVSSSRVKQGKFWFAGQQPKRAWSENFFAKNIEILLSDSGWSDVPDGARRELVYSAWLLVRFLVEEEDDWQAFGDRLGRYLELHAQGLAMTEAFERAFDVSIDELEPSLSAFSQVCCAQWVIGTEKLLPEFKPVAREIPREEIAGFLADIAAAQSDEN